eukprot:7524876-Karenia_brevis.AAC.1
MACLACKKVFEDRNAAAAESSAPLPKGTTIDMEKIKAEIRREVKAEIANTAAPQKGPIFGVAEAATGSSTGLEMPTGICTFGVDTKTGSNGT